MQYFVTSKDFIELKNQKKVTVQQLEDLKEKLNQMFKDFKQEFKEIS